MMGPADQPAVLVEASAAADDRGVIAAPAALLLTPMEESPSAPGPFAWRLLSFGAPAEVAQHPAAFGARRRALPDAILTPAFANAHTHLDLTAIGTVPVGRGGFVGWIQSLRAARRERLVSDEAIEASVERGVALSIAGGVVAVGDIAGDGSLAPRHALTRSPLMGVSFVEFFGLTADRSAALDAVAELAASRQSEQSAIRLGVQPHAPYSTGAAGYAAAADLARTLGVPLASHVAELSEEQQLVAEASGPLPELLESLQLWDETVAAQFGKGCSPVEHIAGALEGARPLLAHCNDVDDRDIERLAGMRAGVACCPRSSAYLGHTQRLGPHRYRDMLAAGVPVALATDSVASLPGFHKPENAGGQRLTPLDDARFLWRRGERDAELLLRMISTAPAGMLGLDPARFRFTAGGAVAGLVATSIAPGDSSDAPADALARLFAGDAPPTLLAPPAAQKATL